MDSRKKPAQVKQRHASVWAYWKPIQEMKESESRRANLTHHPPKTSMLVGYGGRSSAWLEPQIVDLAVAGSNPVDHPTAPKERDTHNNNNNTTRTPRCCCVLRPLVLFLQMPPNFDSKVETGYRW